jgi:acyl-coenzyme A thioesterase PaaI-like protein
MTSFAEATAVRRVDDGSYAATIHPDFIIRITGKAHGGYLLAMLMRAALAESPHAQPVATTAHFLRPGAEGPVEIRLQPHPPGRTVAATRASLTQNGKTLVDATVTTASLSHSDAPQWSIEPPPMPPVEDCLQTEMDHPLGPGPRFLGHLDMRFDPETMQWALGKPGKIPEIRHYFKLVEDYDPDALMIALGVDAKPPVSLSIGLMAPITTVELTLHLRALPAPGWLTMRSTARMIGNGWADEDVDVWDSTGRLVAHSRQLMRILG